MNLVLLTIVDIAISYIIICPTFRQKIEGDDRMIKVDDKGYVIAKDKNPVAYKEWKRLDDQQDVNMFSYGYLFNPFSIYVSLKLSMNSLHYFIPLMAIVTTTNKKFGMGAILFGLSLYEDPHNLLLWAPILLCFVDFTKQSFDKWQFQKYFLVTINTVAILLYLSYLACGNDWAFFEKSILGNIFMTYYEPNVGFSWTLYTAVFNRYRDFYFAGLFLMLISMIFPIYIVFKKYVRRVDCQIEGKQAFFSGICFGVIYLFAPSTTLYDLTTVFIMILTQYEVLRHIKYILVGFGGMGFTILMSGHMTDLWIHGLTGNASFSFFHLLVFGVFYAIVFNEIFTTLNIQTKKLKTQSVVSDVVNRLIDAVDSKK
jgi:hypothetical protein